ncbi:type III PLP-dependent enzyme [Streptomyces marokkonensis]|uniref:Type III PLP-dependent enzyme n=1 Tax=Streptomyces marokkonensis TaxID=324855 RepID=A0ABP7SBX2_9ACTN
MADVSDLVRRYGSPLYVYELDRVEQACADLRAALPAPSTLYYSLKANSHPAVVECLRGAGCRAEVSSTGELGVALDAGFAAADCLYTGPGKTDEEMAFALARGVRRFSAESVGELHRLGRAATATGTEATVLLRINGAAVGATGLRMTGVASQFGVDEEEVRADPAAFTGVPGTRLSGVHLFPISNARDEDSLIASLRAGVSLAARLRDEAGLPMNVVDLGGGFAAPYARPGTRPSYPRLRDALRSALDAELPGWRTGDVEIAFESGRHLVGESGRLAATVQEVKSSRGQTFVVLDAGVNHLGGLSGLGRLALAGATPDPDDGDTAPATVVGPLCTPADVLGRSVRVPAVEVGRTLVFSNTGAYGLNASLVAFLGRPAPAEVVVRGTDVVSATRLRLTHEPITEDAVASERA